MLYSQILKNIHLAFSEVFDVQHGPSERVDDVTEKSRFDLHASPRKDVC